MSCQPHRVTHLRTIKLLSQTDTHFKTLLIYKPFYKTNPYANIKENIHTQTSNTKVWRGPFSQLEVHVTYKARSCWYHCRKMHLPPKTILTEWAQSQLAQPTLVSTVSKNGEEKASTCICKKQPNVNASDTWRKTQTQKNSDWSLCEVFRINSDWSLCEVFGINSRLITLRGVWDKLRLITLRGVGDKLRLITLRGVWDKFRLITLRGVWDKLRLITLRGVWDRLQVKGLPKKISAIKSMNRAVELHSKDITQTQQRPESPTVTCTWHASKCKVHELHWRYIQLFIM